MCCKVLSSASTLRGEVFFCRPRQGFPSAIHWKAVRVMLSKSHSITWPTHLHCFCMTIVSMLSWLLRARSSQMEIVPEKGIAKYYLLCLLVLCLVVCTTLNTQNTTDVLLGQCEQLNEVTFFHPPALRHVWDDGNRTTSVQS